MNICSRLFNKKLISILAAGLLFTLPAVSALAQPRRPQPAPVPPEVVMPRPSDAEVEQAGRDLAAYLESRSPEVRRLYEAYPYLLEVRTLGVNSAIVPSLSPNFREKHEANLEVARGGDIDILFMGDSITDWWRSEREPYAGKPVFDAHFGDMKVANFGIAGDTTQGVLYRLQNGEGQGFSPKAVMLMIGTNNTRANTAGEIAEGVGAVVLELQKDFPDAKILLLAVFPRGAADDPVRAEIAEINSIISRLDDGERVVYMDIGDIFLDEQGNIPRDIMSDGLHPTTRGYELWAEAVKEPLQEML